MILNQNIMISPGDYFYLLSFACVTYRPKVAYQIYLVNLSANVNLSKTCLNSVYLLLSGCLSNIIEPCLSIQTWQKNRWILVDSTVAFAQSKIKKTSSRILTQITNSIFHDNNSYAKCALQYQSFVNVNQCKYKSTAFIGTARIDCFLRDFRDQQLSSGLQGSTAFFVIGGIHRFHRDSRDPLFHWDCRDPLLLSGLQGSTDFLVIARIHRFHQDCRDPLVSSGMQGSTAFFRNTGIHFFHCDFRDPMFSSGLQRSTAFTGTWPEMLHFWSRPL